MEVQDMDKRRFRQPNVGIGLVLIAAGGVLLLRQMGYPLPNWLFTWPMILILVGILAAIKHGFRDFSWCMMLLIGGLFLLDEIYPEAKLKQYLVPGVIMLLGVVFIFKPRNSHFAMARRRHARMRRRMQIHHQRWHEEHAYVSPGVPPADPHVFREADTNVLESTIDVVSVFSGIKKKVISKDFRGGEVTCFFGGAELNLINADFISPIRIEFLQILGGAKLLVPANWEVRSEVTAIFGGIEDKRPPTAGGVPERTIVLDGTVIFGGIEINSF